MQLKKFFLLTFFFFRLSLHTSEYPYNPDVSPEVWQLLQPYFLPFEHPIKNTIDALFDDFRPTLNTENLCLKGFHFHAIRKPTNIIVASHPSVKTYLFKIFLDSQPELCEWENWIKRIEGAKKIQNCINRRGFKNFIVPKKWIYPLPSTKVRLSGYYQKNFILVVEKIDLLGSKENLKVYRKLKNKRLLKELFTLLKEESLIDSVYPDNIPFTKNGKIAFIDTEHHVPSLKVPYEKLIPYLSEEAADYWIHLINNDLIF